MDARRVGVEAYAQAGGVLTSDLFDGEDRNYLVDAPLLDRLVAAKPEMEAQTERGEDWVWVTKDSILDAVREGVSERAARQLFQSRE